MVRSENLVHNLCHRLGRRAAWDGIGEDMGSALLCSSLPPGISAMEFRNEGLITIVLGILTFFFVPDFPDKNRFIVETQTKTILDRVERDRGDSAPDEITLQRIFFRLSGWALWAYALVFMCSTMSAYAIGFFITIILHAMGYSTTMALVLTAPPYVVAAISCYVFACRVLRWLAFLLRLTRNPLVPATLVCSSLTQAPPGVLAYVANNIVSHSKRVVSTAVTPAFGGIGGIATTVFCQKDFPRYLSGIWAKILIVILCVVLTWHYIRKNKRVRESKGINEETIGFIFTL
ncbi:Allantoate permease [Leucoagaricus sp. SymC.cos]|nr:Allantoate permease [Leucoagaricus sp. SymC.cos]